MINTCLKLLIALFLTSAMHADSFYERYPIDYEGSEESNEISRLQLKIDAGLKLKYDNKHGYLNSVLEALKISKHSQILVFSKTSVHRKIISPSNPRAIYFNTNSYVGWVDGARVLEFAVADKNLGAVFYTMDQKKTEKPVFERDDSCLSCHASSRTKNEPGFFIRSIFPDKKGEPIARAGEERVDHTTPLEKRWGGWFVTADKLSFAHRGNGITVENDQEFKIVSQKATTAADLKQFFNPSKYLTDTSDIQALMTIEHQAEMHNILTSTKFRVLHALHNEKVINNALGESGRRDITTRILSNAANEILDGLLFVDESSLKNVEISGIQNFKEDFESCRPLTKGLSLYQLDFQERISRFPCSWVIYSDSFKGLPTPLKDLVVSRLKGILTAEELPDRFIHLRKTRQNIDMILSTTLKIYK